MGNVISFPNAVSKDDDKFDEFMSDFFDGVTNIPDPGEATEDLADVTKKLNSLRNGLIERGLIK